MIWMHMWIKCEYTMCLTFRFDSFFLSSSSSPYVYTTTTTSTVNWFPCHADGSRECEHRDCDDTMNSDDLFEKKWNEIVRTDSDNNEHRKHRIVLRQGKDWTCETVTFVVWLRLWDIQKSTSHRNKQNKKIINHKNCRYQNKTKQKRHSCDRFYEK